MRVGQGGGPKKTKRPGQTLHALLRALHDEIASFLPAVLCPGRESQYVPAPRGNTSEAYRCFCVAAESHGDAGQDGRLSGPVHADEKVDLRAEVDRRMGVTLRQSNTSASGR